jgi:hypothetical protein
MPSTEKSEEAINRAKLLKNVPWCDDYEKMISGMVFVPLSRFAGCSLLKENRYNSFVPELVQGRFRARKLAKKFNEYFPDNATNESLEKDRHAMLKEIFGHIGTGVDIDPPFRVDYGCNISIGDNFYANFGCVLRIRVSMLEANF